MPGKSPYGKGCAETDPRTEAKDIAMERERKGRRKRERVCTEKEEKKWGAGGKEEGTRISG